MENIIITAQEVYQHFGNPEKIQGSEEARRCPICAATGGDTKGDNLKYNFKKSLLWCFANQDHGAELLKQMRAGTIQNNFIPTQKKQKVKPIIPPEVREKHLIYQNTCNENLSSNDRALKYLFDKRGITTDTVDFCGIGMDLDKIITKKNTDGKEVQYKSKCWILPVFNQNSIAGFEYRGIDLDKKRIWKEDGTPSVIAEINGYTSNTEIGIILEGFFDGYLFWQHLKERGQEKYYHILTPSNGVATVLELLKDFDFTRYKKFILYLDSDNKGIPVMGKAKELYPFIETIIMTCGCKDFNEHYLKCIKKEEVLEHAI